MSGDRNSLPSDRRQDEMPLPNEALSRAFEILSYPQAQQKAAQDEWDRKRRRPTS